MRAYLATAVTLGLLAATTPALAQMRWQQVVGSLSATPAGFGDANNRMVMSSVVHGGYLYAGTFNHDTGSEVWRTANGTSWTRVSSDGFSGNTTDYNAAAYSMAVFDGSVNAATWATGWPSTPGSVTRVWRYSSGTSWSQVNPDGFGDSSNAEPWAMVVFDSLLYVGTANYPDGAEIWRRTPTSSWTQANVNGFGNGSNIEVTAMAELGGYLYAATRNEATGLEVWRSTSGSSWTRVNITPGFGGANHFAAYAMAVLDGTLYLSTFNMSSGGTVYRTSNGTTWTEVVQAAGGFGDANNYGSYAMTVYDGALLLGTFNWSTGAEVWRTTDGTTWTQVNNDGFGKASSSAVLSWSELNGFLYAGLRNDNGCEVWRSPSLIFADGFDKGGTGSWSATVP